MLEDKLKATDWESTDETIAEVVARESYLQWLKDNQTRHTSAGAVSKILAFISHTCSRLCSQETRSVWNQYETSTDKPCFYTGPSRSTPRSVLLSGTKWVHL